MTIVVVWVRCPWKSWSQDICLTWLSQNTRNQRGCGHLWGAGLVWVEYLPQIHVHLGVETVLSFENRLRWGHTEMRCPIQKGRGSDINRWLTRGLWHVLPTRKDQSKEITSARQLKHWEQSTRMCQKSNGCYRTQGCLVGLWRDKSSILLPFSQDWPWSKQDFCPEEGW